MNERALQLALKKQRLQLRSAAQRQAFAKNAAGLAPLAALADTGVAGVNWLRGHPQWVLGAVTVLSVLRPRRMLWLAARLWSATRIFRRLSAFLV